MSELRTGLEVDGVEEPDEVDETTLKGPTESDESANLPIQAEWMMMVTGLGLGLGIGIGIGIGMGWEGAMIVKVESIQSID